MSAQDNVCYTFEAALEKAVKMEDEGYRNYLSAMRKVKDKEAKKILQEAALDELGHKLQLEKALVEGAFEGEETMSRPVPTMNLDHFLHKKTIKRGADVRDALEYAIHSEKEAVDFYRKMSAGCAGAPMEKVFTKIGNDETRHLQALEDLYEKYYMSDN
jgi:rubrerythrin